MPASPIPRSRRGLPTSAACQLQGSPADFGKLIADETEKVGQGGQVRGHQGGLNRADGDSITPFRECAPMTAAGPNPDFLLGGRTSASAELQTLVRGGSPLVKLRNSA